jgi:molecular chaperone Hsp33
MTHDAPTDHLTRFLIEQAGVRGVHVRLDATWQQIRARADYPAAVADLLGQAIAASALFTGHTKVDGRLSIQFRGSGALRTLFAECTGAGTLRGIATVAEGQDADAGNLRALGDDALLAITIENPGARGQEPTRYQSLVALDADTLSQAFEGYFVQSEQLPTRLLLAADGERVAGLMLQKLPGDEGDEHGWQHASVLFDTLGAMELLETPADLLLHRLFHQDGVQMLGGKPLRFGCSCSRERVTGMLQTLGEAEARAAAEANAGSVDVHCEFCGQAYRFDSADLDTLFATPTGSAHGAPDRLQ